MGEIEKQLSRARRASRAASAPGKKPAREFDPAGATSVLKQAVLALENSLTVFPWEPGYADELRTIRDGGWKAVDGMQDWKARGGSVPRAFWYTWTPRFDAVLIAQRDQGGIESGR